MKTLFAMFAMFALVACGDINVPDTAQTKNQTDPGYDQTDTTSSTPTVKGHEKKGTDGTVTKTTAAAAAAAGDGAAAASASTTTTITHCAEKWRFDGRQMTWLEAMTSAPAGWRIPKRAEVADGWDEGELDEFLNQTISVWTATETPVDENAAFFFSLTNGTDYAGKKGYHFNLLFICTD